MKDMENIVKCLTHCGIMEIEIQGLTIVDESTMLTFDIYSRAHAGPPQNVIY